MPRRAHLGKLGPTVLVAALALPRTALAGEPSVQVHAPADGCWGPSVEAEMTAELSSLFVEKETRIVISSARDAVTFTVTTAEEELGARTIDVRGGGCADIVSTVTIAIALALEDLGLTKPASPIVSTPDPAVWTPAPESVALLAGSMKTEEVHVEPAPSTAPVEPSVRVAIAVEVGVGVAITGLPSVMTGVAADVAYAAPSGGAVRPELSGRGGALFSLPSRVVADEQDLSVSLYAARFDGCGGLSNRAFRVRGCGSVIMGAFGVDGESTTTFIAGGRLEGTWRATRTVGLLLAADALSVVAPSAFVAPAAESGGTVSQDTSEFALAFATGVVAECF